MEMFMNVESEWDDSIDAGKEEGAVKRTEVEKVQCAKNCMKIRKASGRYCSNAIWVYARERDC